MTDETPGSSAILIVDDDIIARHLLAEYLRHCGYRVIEASGSAEALVVLKSAEVPVDVVLSGIEVEGENGGFGLAKWIRAHHPGVDLILASSLDRAADAAGDLCEDGPLAKPYEPQIVVDRIKRLRAVRLAKSEDHGG